MSKKQLIHAWIDSETYFQLKNSEINISGTMNELLKSFFAFDKLPKKQEEQIEEEIKEIRSQEEKLVDKRNKLTSYLVHLRNINKKKEVEELDTALKMADSFRDSGMFTGGR